MLTLRHDPLMLSLSPAPHSFITLAAGKILMLLKILKWNSGHAKAHRHHTLRKSSVRSQTICHRKQILSCAYDNGVRCKRGAEREEWRETAVIAVLTTAAVWYLERRTLFAAFTSSETLQVQGRLYEACRRLFHECLVMHLLHVLDQQVSPTHKIQHQDLSVSVLSVADSSLGADRVYLS